MKWAILRRIMHNWLHYYGITVDVLTPHTYCCWLYFRFSEIQIRTLGLFDVCAYELRKIQNLIQACTLTDKRKKLNEDREIKQAVHKLSLHFQAMITKGKHQKIKRKQRETKRAVRKLSLQFWAFRSKWKMRRNQQSLLEIRYKQFFFQFADNFQDSLLQWVQ